MQRRGVLFVSVTATYLITLLFSISKRELFTWADFWTKAQMWAGKDEYRCDRYIKQGQRKKAKMMREALVEGEFWVLSDFV